MARPSRRTAAVAATLAAALAAGATVALTTRDRGGVASLTALDETPEVSSPLPSPEPSDSESPTPSPAPRETASATPEPEPEPEPSSTEPPEPEPTATASKAAYGGLTDYGPRTPGSVTVPYTPGQRSWDVTSNGVRVRVSMTPAKVGEPVTFTVTASASGDGCCAIYVLFGDGHGRPSGLPCATPDASVSYSHTFNRSRRHEFMVSAATKKQCGDGSQAVVYGTFDVAPGTSTAQGPSLPQVTFADSSPVKGHEGDPHYVSMHGEAHEEDGWITKLVVTFGDGTSKTFPGDDRRCTETPDGWPNSSFSFLPSNPPAYHYYKKPGTYTLTLTAYSAACDGSQVQTGKKSFTWTVPAPEPTETPTASPTG